MGIVYRGASSVAKAGNGGATDTITIGWPSVSANDTMLLIIDPVVHKGLAFGSPAGFSNPNTSAGLTGGSFIAAYSKTWLGTEAGTLAINFAGTVLNTDLTAIGMSFSGIDTTTPYDTGGAGTGTTNTSLTATGVTTARNNELIVASYLYTNASAFTPPAGMVLRMSVAGPANYTMAVCTSIKATAGATGNLVATIGSTSVYAWTVQAFNPQIVGAPFWTNFLLSSEVDA